MRHLIILFVVFSLGCSDDGDVGTADVAGDSVSSDGVDETVGGADASEQVTCSEHSGGGDPDSCEVEFSECSDGVIYTAACTDTGAGTWACACYETGQPGETGSFVSDDLCELTNSVEQQEAALEGCDWDLE